MNGLTRIIADDVAPLLTANFNVLHGKTVLVTGASGLIGTYFLASLAACRARGIDVRVVAVMRSPFPAHLADFVRDADCREGDITDREFLASLPDADYILHAAGYGQPGKFMEDPLKTIEINTTCTISLLRKVNPNGTFLFLSTSEVYSGLPTPPYKEEEIGTTNTCHPRACYIEGKRCGEAAVNAWRSGGNTAKSARLSLVYGPGTKKGDARVLNSFIRRGLTEKVIALMDRGEAKRTYCYVADALAMLWNIALRGTEPIYNVGGTSKTTIGGLADRIGGVIGVPVRFPAADAAMPGAPEDVSLDMSKVENEFGYPAYVSLEDGLARTIEWQRLLYAENYD